MSEIQKAGVEAIQELNSAHTKINEWIRKWTSSTQALTKKYNDLQSRKQRFKEILETMQRTTQFNRIQNEVCNELLRQWELIFDE